MNHLHDDRLVVVLAVLKLVDHIRQKACRLPREAVGEKNFFVGAFRKEATETDPFPLLLLKQDE